jgi:Xaa-Pro aminopeptidase
MSQSLFNQDFFINNRKKLKGIFIGTAPIVLTANGLLQQNSDNTYPFRQDSSFWYFTGINLPGALLVMDRDDEYLIVPNQSEFSEFADGIVDYQEIIDVSGIKIIFDQELGWKKLGSRLKKVKHVAILPGQGPYIESLGFYVNPARQALTEKIKSANTELKLLDISGHISRLRSIKQEPEIKAISQAIDITTDTFKVIKKNLKKYNYEYEIEATVLSEFRRKNSVPAYQSIIASGLNSCTLHYNTNNSKLNPRNLVLIDIGASVENYAADITRTISLNDEMSRREQQIFDAVIEVQDFAISLVKPGFSFRKYESEVEQYMGERLRSLGIIDSASSANIRKFYPHSTSHFLGLDPHDVGDYELVFEPGMVITIEPGIYVPNEEIGIRVEDDFLVTDSWVICLSRNLPSKLN